MCDISISVPLDQLKKYDKDLQVDAMRKWFFERYEDPGHRTPYESREGGFQWIWGGPYDAREQLEAHFSEYIPDETIDELVEELEGDCYEWAPVESPGDYDDYFVDDVADIEDCHKEFNNAIGDVQSLLSIDVPDEVSNKFYSLLFVNVITALEAYLSDKFIKRVMNDKEALRKFVESTPGFGNEKIPVSEVLKVVETIEGKVRSYLSAIVWHNLGRIEPMYKSALEADLGDIGPMMEAVAKRHHIVHRNGHNKDGDSIDVSMKEIHDIVSRAESLVNNIEEQLVEPF